MTLDELTTPHHGIYFHLNWKPQEVDSVHNWKHNWKQNTTQCHLESQNYDLHIYCTEAKLTMYRNIDVKLSISVLISCEQCYQEKKCLKLISLLKMLLVLFIKMKYLTSGSDSVFSPDFYLARLNLFFIFTSVFAENTD